MFSVQVNRRGASKERQGCTNVKVPSLWLFDQDRREIEDDLGKTHQHDDRHEHDAEPDRRTPTSAPA